MMVNSTVVISKLMVNGKMVNLMEVNSHQDMDGINVIHHHQPLVHMDGKTEYSTMEYLEYQIQQLIQLGMMVNLMMVNL
jgi:hypothetical protein